MLDVYWANYSRLEKFRWFNTYNDLYKFNNLSRWQYELNLLKHNRFKWYRLRWHDYCILTIINKKEA